MADDHDDSTSTTAGTSVEKSAAQSPSPGTAVVVADRIENPGFRPYRPRITDLNPKKAKAAERAVSGMFLLSIVGSVLAVAAYIAIPIVASDPASVSYTHLTLPTTPYV